MPSRQRLNQLTLIADGYCIACNAKGLYTKERCRNCSKLASEAARKRYYRRIHKVFKPKPRTYLTQRILDYEGS